MKQKLIAAKTKKEKQLNKESNKNSTNDRDRVKRKEEDLERFVWSK